MTKEEMQALLGRPLTQIENENFDLYLDIALESLEYLTCLTFIDDSSSGSDVRIYDTREGYSTVFTDIFTEVNSVKIGETLVDPDKYTVRQWDRRKGSWYNSIVFDRTMRKRDEYIEVDAVWGFETFPSDLQSVIAGLFAQITKKNKYDPTVQSKQNRDFRIAFKADVDLDDSFYNTYRRIINKYSICNIYNVQHGDVSCGC